ncbi:WbqC-like family protein [Formosa agariphila KMM 3901]|uniref:WbqC-like family protein n=1 Tax=Formosa agariphila (strain DSM 15362 / KCTC 12365 / LMG 23005 / KMM 3901 / M-2Alg 35-1) TaxID=1347342 RepID=T2KM53_FORAG|nr:WbqC-like family protein [Formosa agariphila KMM 3901]
MNILLHPTYFPDVAHMAAIAQSDVVTFEMDDNFAKQTYRTRTYIYGANGKLLLNIPVVYTQKNRQKYRDVKVSNAENWQSIHWKSLLSAYKTSPFFEYYEDDLHPLFEMKVDYILDYNLKCFEVISECLQLEKSILKTEEFKHEVEDASDLRHLVNPKLDLNFQNEKYTQVFDDKHGFINNLSVLDLLFNEGPNALDYLENQDLSL